jgi:hypothetical protein
MSPPSGAANRGMQGTETGLLSAARNSMTHTSNDGVQRPLEGHGIIRSNPGWLPSDPNQRTAHEAPARLGRPSDTDPMRTSHGPPTDGPPANAPGASRSRIPRPKKQATADQSSGPQQRTAGEMTLRTVNRPPAPPPSTPQPKRQTGGPTGPSNLQPGTAPRPAGHVWRPGDPPQQAPETPTRPGPGQAQQPQSVAGSSGSNERPRLFGAPVPHQNSETRQPPRPQNIQAYQRQQSEQRQQAQQQQEAQQRANSAAQHAGTTPGSRYEGTNPHQDSVRYQDNLSRFNRDHPVRPPPSGGRQEAPARMTADRPATNNPPAASRPQQPPTPQRRPSRIPVRQPQRNTPSTSTGPKPPPPKGGASGSGSKPPPRGKLRRRWSEMEPRYNQYLVVF